MELWDAYTEEGELAGLDLVRGNPVPDGLFHMVCEILVRHTDGTYLLTQRDYGKPNYPGLFAASAGGSVIKGEVPLEGAFRELYEETGIKAEELVSIYHVISPKNHTIYFGYLCITDMDKNAVRLQETETISYLWLTEDEFLKFIETDRYVQPHRRRLSSYLKSQAAGRMQPAAGAWSF